MSVMGCWSTESCRQVHTIRSCFPRKHLPQQAHACLPASKCNTFDSLLGEGQGVNSMHSCCGTVLRPHLQHFRMKHNVFLFGTLQLSSGLEQLNLV